jgi:hypothetical protein
MLTAQNAGMVKTIDIVVQALDGRNGKPLANQHLLVFTGTSSNAVKSHAEHTGLTTDKDGVGTLTIYPAETQWIQVWADGRVLCQPEPNQSSFSVATIMSKGLATPNTCSALVREPTPGHFHRFCASGSLHREDEAVGLLRTTSLEMTSWFMWITSECGSLTGRQFRTIESACNFGCSLTMARIRHWVIIGGSPQIRA